MNRTESENLQKKLIKDIYSRIDGIRKQREQDCQHLAGCSPLSDLPIVSVATSIVWHGLRDETQIGICLVCQRRFLPSDPDYKFWFNKKSYSRRSGSDDGVWKPVSKEEYEEGIKRQGDICYPKSPKSLDELSDMEITYLYEKSILKDRKQ